MTLYTPHRPYKYYRIPAFIIHASDRFLTIRTDIGDTRVFRLDEWRVPHMVIYSCVSPDDLCLYGFVDKWLIRTWQGRISSMSYGDVRIYPLTGDGWDETIPTLFDYIDSRGIAAAGVNTMSLNLWRSTLRRAVRFDEQAPSIESMLGPIAVATGGRKECRAGVYRHRVEYDITAAYPTALATIPIPSTLAPITEPAEDLDAYAGWDGIAVARVRIPPLEWGPIPVLLDRKSEVTCYGYTRANEWATVTLPLSELRLARSYGCDVILCNVSLGIDGVRAFASWYDHIVPDLRGLLGCGGALGKLISNRLWSCFAVRMDGERKEHTFTDDGSMISHEVPPDHPAWLRRRASTAYIGAMVQGRVRERLYREGLTQLPEPIYCDTDSVIAKTSDHIPMGWRTKTNMRYLDIAGTQAYTYRCPDCVPAGSTRKGHSGPHWTVAGASDLISKSVLFRIIKSGGFLVTNVGNTIPAQDVNRGNETVPATVTQESLLPTRGA